MLSDVLQAIRKLSRSEKIYLMEKILEDLKREEGNEKDEELDWRSLRGLGKGLWDEDAQKYINKLREE